MKSHFTFALLFFFLSPKLIGQEYCKGDFFIKPKLITDYQNRGNRCEGFYVPKFTTEEVNIVSVLYGRLVYELNKNEILKIFCPIKKELKVNISAISIPLRMYYRMDSEILAFDTLYWDLNPVILSKRIHHNYIGIIGKVSEEERIWITPLKTKALKSNLFNDDNLRLTFRSINPIKNVKYRWWNINDSKIKSEYKSLEKEVYWGGESIIISDPEFKSLPNKTVFELRYNKLNTNVENTIKIFLLTKP